MTTGLWWAAVVSAALLVASGCGEVESCKRGETGCLDGPADALTGECSFGLVANSQQICEKKGSGTVGPIFDNCGCAPGSLCNDLRQCVDLCVLPNNLPVKKPTPTKCRPSSDPRDEEPPYDFMQAAAAACTQECVRRAEYCGTPCNPDVECAPGNLPNLVNVLGPCANNRTPECAMQECEKARDKPCSEHKCGATGAPPSCAGVTCTSRCPNAPQYANDGFCDDGDLSNATSAICGWGSDCGDCGPRKGAAPPTALGLGDICVDPIQCGGDTEDVRRATGWCVRFDLGAEVLRCVPDCSVSPICPSGFECEELVYEENGVNKPLRDDLNMQIARACFPSLMCGN